MYIYTYDSVFTSSAWYYTLQCKQTTVFIILQNLVFHYNYKVYRSLNIDILPGKVYYNIYSF